MLGLSVGILLMSVQLWLLTLAFNLYLSGERGRTLIVAVASGGIFAGGVATSWFLRWSARQGRPSS